MESVILVDDKDQELGVMEKMEAHRKGILHRAISIFVFNTQGDYLIQQRAFEKYHSAGKWSNTCCSHPRPGEKLLDAANRRLKEEMGMVCDLAYWFSFTYRAELDHGLVEHEYDHVFMGITDELPNPDASEVASFKYISREALEDDLVKNPEHYSEWFKICLKH
ncbi:isopentenyl-diphosphate Delta-isomerase [Mucilaginibacter calamicampi]|uniref:Isopentenyl-diphosphate delta-isomerase n=1 Tax=Mucilaginibacter calamicampi TaxID=1302352 RepID=A0ABW2YTS0_9SPHI